MLLCYGHLLPSCIDVLTFVQKRYWNHHVLLVTYILKYRCLQGHFFNVIFCLISKLDCPVYISAMCILIAFMKCFGKNGYNIKSPRQILCVKLCVSVRKTSLLHGHWKLSVLERTLLSAVFSECEVRQGHTGFCKWKWQMSRTWFWHVLK